MDGRLYQQPSTSQLATCITKESKELNADEIQFLKRINDCKLLNAPKIFLGAVIYLNEIAERPILKTALGISDTNPLDDKSKFIYLMHLAEYVKKNQIKLSSREAKDTQPLEDKILARAEALLSPLALQLFDTQSVPKKLMEQLQELPNRYAQACKQKSYARRLFEAIPLYDRSDDRQEQIDFISNLCRYLSTLDPKKHDLEAIIQGFCICLMRQHEAEYDTSSQLYTLLQTITKVSHSDEIPLWAKKNYFDELRVFIQNTLPKKWGTSADFVVKLKQYIPAPEEIKEPTPSYLSTVASNTYNYITSYAVAKTIRSIAQSLHHDFGIGKNIIPNAMGQLFSRAGYRFFGPLGYFLKDTGKRVGLVVEGFVPTGIELIIFLSLGYYNRAKSRKKALPTTDIVARIINRAQRSAKTDIDREFFDRIQALYEMMPDQTKQLVSQIKPKSEPVKMPSVAEQAHQASMRV